MILHSSKTACHINNPILATWMDSKPQLAFYAKYLSVFDMVIFDALNRHETLELNAKSWWTPQFCPVKQNEMFQKFGLCTFLTTQVGCFFGKAYSSGSGAESLKVVD